MSTKPNVLRKLKIEELTLCGRPANQGAVSLLHKADEGGDSIVRKFLNLFRAPNASAVDKDEEPVDLTAPEAITAASTLALHETLTKLQGDDSLTPDARKAAVTAALKEFEQTVTNTSAEPDDMTTNATPEALAKAQDELKKAQDEKVALEKKLADIEKAQKDGERLTLAKSLVEGTPVLAENVAKLLGQLDADGQQVLKTIVAQTKAVAKDAKLLEEIGKGGKAGDEGDPAKLLEKKAQEIHKADPKLSQAQAMRKAVEQNPDLYAASVGAVDEGEGAE